MEFSLHQNPPGIPLGIAFSVPILLQNRGVSYADQAGFSFAFYPMTCELSFLTAYKRVFRYFVAIFNSEDILGTAFGRILF